VVAKGSGGPDRNRPPRTPRRCSHELRPCLPAPDSELVRDAIKDPYNFEFLVLSERAHERDLELDLLHDIQSFLVEMGRGFALVGRQFPLRIVDQNLTLTPTPTVEMEPALPDLSKLASEPSDIVEAAMSFPTMTDHKTITTPVDLTRVYQRGHCGARSGHGADYPLGLRQTV
jgi:YhcG PDDEXK nuclease domain